MTTQTCSNETWAADNNADIEWARWMWSCDCDKCPPLESGAR